MKFSTIVSAALSVIAATSSPIQRRAVGGVLMCTGANATGECNYGVYEMETCHQLPAPFYHNISTFAVDGEAFTCFPRVYDCGAICTSPTGCTFGGVNFTYEHKYDLSAIKWNDIFGSFDCMLDTTV